MRQFFSILKNYNELKKIKTELQHQERVRFELEQELKSVGFNIDALYDNPFNGIGSALEILHKYGATLHRGTCHGDCRVSLPKQSWKYPIKSDVDMWILHPWMEQSQKISEYDEISVWGRTVQEATAKMLINCRRAGVI